MSVLESKINLDSSEFHARRDAMTRLVDELNSVYSTIQAGGTDSARKKHVARGKLLARDRIRLLLDRATPFLEIAPYAACEMYGGEVPSAGIVTGIGSVSGRECMIFANDATVKGGTYYPITVKKHLRAQEIASENLSSVHLSG